MKKLEFFQIQMGLNRKFQRSIVLFSLHLELSNLFKSIYNFENSNLRNGSENFKILTAQGSFSSKRQHVHQKRVTFSRLTAIKQLAPIIYAQIQLLQM